MSHHHQHQNRYWTSRVHWMDGWTYECIFFYWIILYLWAEMIVINQRNIFLLYTCSKRCNQLWLCVCVCVTPVQSIEISIDSWSQFYVVFIFFWQIKLQNTFLILYDNNVHFVNRYRKHQLNIFFVFLYEFYKWHKWFGWQPQGMQFFFMKYKSNEIEIDIWPFVFFFSSLAWPSIESIILEDRWNNSFESLILRT